MIDCPDALKSELDLLNLTEGACFVAGAWNFEVLFDAVRVAFGTKELVLMLSSNT